MQSEVTGKGDPLVLVPGGLTGWISWKPFAEKLSISRKVIRVQLLVVELGLKNQPLPQDYSVGYETLALTHTLDQLGIKHADFAAWSYGAEITLNFALNNPERVRTLTLIEPPAIWVLRNKGLMGEEMLKQREQIKRLGPSDISEEQLVWFTHFAGFVPPDVDPRSLPSWQGWMQHRQSLRTQDVVFKHDDTLAKVNKFTKPVLLFKGEDSSAFLNKIIDVLGEEFPNSQVEALPGGHALHIVSMDQFMKIFTTFLKQQAGF